MHRVLDKYRSMSMQAKSAIWFTACSVLQKGISFITVPVFTRLLTSEQYGIYSVYLSWLDIFTIFTSMYLYAGVFNNGMTKYDKDRDTYISAMQGLTLSITFIYFIIFGFAGKYWSDLVGLSSHLLILMFIEMLVTPAFYFWSGRQRFEYRYHKLVVLTLAKSVANPVFGLILVLNSEDKATARILSIVLVELAFSGVVMVIQFTRGKRFVHMEYWKYALKLAVPLVPHYLSGMILNQGDRVMIDHMVGKSEVAYYSVAYNIGMLVQIITAAIINSFTPWIYQRIKANDVGQIKKTINILLIIVSIVSFGLMMCSPELVLIFGSEKYASAVYVIPPVAASVFFIFLYNMLAIPEFYFEETKFLATSSIIAAGVNVLLNYIFIKMFGFVAAGYTTLTCYVLYALGHYYVSRRITKKYIPKETLFDERVILILSSITIVAGVCCNFTFSFWYIRYTILLLLLVLAYYKRNLIICFIKRIRK